VCKNNEQKKRYLDSSCTAAQVPVKDGKLPTTTTSIVVFVFRFLFFFALIFLFRWRSSLVASLSLEELVDRPALTFFFFFFAFFPL
jgi:hypothetical protein